ncbi:MAG: choice-of-anchor D domain-containing protein, partial [FCB group bacterium]|nr:choice-of-anchor D domain-containing protein [FCB group bacterium]
MLSKTNSTMAVIVLLIICSSAFGQTVIATYEIHDHASGLAYDGENIWYGRYGTGGEWVYKFDTQLGAVTDSIDLGATNLDDAYGLTWDGQYLWTISHTGSDFIIKFDTAGNIVQAFPTPSNYMSGLAWNGTDFYMSDYYEPDGAIYKVDVNGQIIENFTAPDTQPWDLAWDGQNLWMCDYWSDWIYQIDPVTHETLFSFESPITEPAGIAWDGQYLWVSDEGDGYNIDHLYIIAPFGAGTPGIEISAEELDFGFVPTGMTPSMEFLITSIGDADLTVSDIGLSGFNLAFFVDSTITYPFSLSPGENRSVSVYYSPFQFGESFGTVHVHSDDPINPEVTVDLSGYGIYPDQTVSVSTTYIDYGEVWIARLDGLTGEPLEIDNKGAVPLYLISVEIDDPAFYCTGFTPGNLASMDTLALTVYFEPELPQTYSGVLSLTTDDPVQPVVEIQLQGYGNYSSLGTGGAIW